ncbi:MAG: lamin tail domain-containing protein [Bacteroidales bacterium]|jgi:hypothetical protein|nr:lamin tail domain-containing protein [Bacteroidales bacterium]MDD4742760.1 lamin tail domain-containing protein [Bacteroidales bacterium]MDY0333956.1 lamin tail domain-containing protein [Bacteroidales bacterium]NLO51964.1 T9SS type A sorting domain-containing protein [Bacteroidales bacterium]
MKKSVLFIVALLMSGFMMAQNCSDLFISEYVEGSGNNKAIEIYNPTTAPINLNGYQLVRYSNGGTTPNAVNLSGVVPAKDVYVVVLDKRDPNGTGNEIMVDPELQAKADTFCCPVYDVNKAMYFNGNDAMTLEKNGGSITLDIVARIGNPDPDNGWTSITDTTITYNSGGVPTTYTITDYIVGPLFWLSWTKDHTLVRKYDVKHGVTENPNPFIVTMEWDSLPKNTFDHLGYHECECNSLSVKELVEGVDIRFYPNPLTEDILTIETLEKIYNLKVYNTAGQTVIDRQLNGVNETMVNTTTLQHGVYFVKVGFDGTSFIKKIIKQ